MADVLCDDPALAAFHDWACPWNPDDDWFLSLVEGAGSILDLGCGRGILAAAMAARGAEVVGAEPAGPMLAIARARAGGDRVIWAQTHARELDLGRRFEAVAMTGHAFQTLLIRADRKTGLKMILRHLAPGGQSGQWASAGRLPGFHSYRWAGLRQLLHPPGRTTVMTRPHGKRPRHAHLLTIIRSGVTPCAPLPFSPCLPPSPPPPLRSAPRTALPSKVPARRNSL